MKTYNITLLGSEQSGKTCFLAGLGILSEGDRFSDFHLSSKGDSKQMIYDLTSTLNSQKWPVGTTSFHKFDGNLRYRGNDLHINFIEYAGERFREAFAAGTEISQDLYNSIKDSDYLLLALEPEVEVSNSNTLNDSIEFKNLYKSRLDSLLESLHQILLQRGNEIPLKIGILIMKGDKISSDISNPKQADEYMHKAAPAFYDRLKKDYPNLKVFGISSVGQTEQNENGDKIPAKSLQPWGYDHLFDWIISDIKSERMKPVYNVMAIIAGILLVLGASWYGYLRIQDNNKYNQWKTYVRRGIEQENINEAERLARQLSSSSYNACVDELLERSDELLDDPNLSGKDDEYVFNGLKALSHTNRSYRNQDILTAIINWNSKIQEEDFLQVKRAYENGFDNFQILMESFMKNYPNSPYTKSLEEWSDQKIQKQIKKDALKIYSMKANSFQAITNKSQAILQFIQNYPNLSNSADMEDASNQAMRLVNESRKEEIFIELRNLGTLNEPEYLKLDIFLDNNPAIKTKWPPNKQLDFSFEDEKSHKLTWKPNQKILIEVKIDGGTFSWRADAAEKTLDGDIALSNLDGEILLNLVNEGLNKFSNDQPILKCDVLNWEEEHWQLIHDWISPGEKWLEIGNND